MVSPLELLLDATEYGVTVDLWSANCILAELLAGKPIMPGRTEVEQLHKIFKLCGSPSEGYRRKSRLPYVTIFKPQHPYRRCVAETFKDFVNNVNFDCPTTEFSLQAMDSSHVVLVAFLLKSMGFEHYRCDHNISMGTNVTNMSKMLKCVNNDDTITIRADNGNGTFTFESLSQDRISDFEMKLMDIDSKRLGILKVEYHAIVKMSLAEFARILKDLSNIGAIVAISRRGDDFVAFIAIQ